MTLNDEIAAHRRIFGEPTVRPATPSVTSSGSRVAFDTETHAVAPGVHYPIPFVAHNPVYDLAAVSTQLGVTSQTTWRERYADIDLLDAVSVVPTPAPKRPAWIKLARVLAHELRDCRGSVSATHYYGGITWFPLGVVGREGEEPARSIAADTGDAQEDYELAEALVSALAEALPHLAKAASGDASKTPTTKCPQCDAAAGTWCRPLHEGERIAGGWQHPGRRALAEGAARAVELVPSELGSYIDFKSERAALAAGLAVAYPRPK